MQPRAQVLPFFAVFLFLLPFNAPLAAQQRAAGEELIGVWEGTTGAYRTLILVGRPQGAWRVEMRYFDAEGNLVGLGRGEDIRLEGESLQFRRVFERKPEAGWLDTDSTLDVVDGRLRYAWRAGGQTGTREFSRMERTRTPLAAEPNEPAVREPQDAEPGLPEPSLSEPEPAAREPIRTRPPTGTQPAPAEPEAEGGFRVLVTHPIKPTPGDAETSVDNWAALSPAGTHWALYRRNGEFELRSIPENELLQKINVKGHVTSLHFSVDGKTLAVTTTGGEERQLGDPRPDPNETAIYSVPSGERRQLIDHAGMVVPGHKAGLSADGKYFAAATNPLDGGAKMLIWNTENGEQILNLTEGVGEGYLAFSANGKWLAVFGTPILAIEIGAGKRKELEQPLLGVKNMAIHPEGKLVAISSEKGEVALISTANGKAVGRFQAYKQAAGPLTFANQGKLLLTSATADPVIRAYDEKGKVVAEIPIPEGVTPTQLFATPDGRFLIAKLYGISQQYLIWSTPWGESP